MTLGKITRIAENQYMQNKSVKIGMDEEKATRKLEEFYPEDTSTDDVIKLLKVSI